jgi:hypothetical protein
MNRGKPKVEISDRECEIYINLIKAGDSDRNASKITGISVRTWERWARTHEVFAQALKDAKCERGGALADALRSTMLTMVQSGHPWWAKLAIHNYNVGLIDPDYKVKKKIAAIAAKIEAEKSKPPSAENIFRVKLNLTGVNPESADADSGTGRNAAAG